MSYGHIEKARRMRLIIERAAQSLDDETALSAVELHPEWKSRTDYAVGFKVRWGGILYRCLTAHTSQDVWTPDASPSLWAKVLVSEDGTALAWEQPDNTNPYMVGDEVTHNGKTWISDVDNNVWEPGVYGWTEKTE